MSEEILKRIDALAAKLNTTAAQIWDVYVAQARMEIVYNVLYAIVWTVFAVAAFRFGKFWHAKTNEPLKGYCSDHDGEWMCTIASACVFILALGATASLIAEIATLAFNPRYWAIQQIIGALK